MSKITFSEAAWEEYLGWQMEDKKTLKRINLLLKEIQRQPFSGKGHPEPLRGNLAGVGVGVLMKRTDLFMKFLKI